MNDCILMSLADPFEVPVLVFYKRNQDFPYNLGVVGFY